MGFGKSWKVIEIEKCFSMTWISFIKFSFFESGLWKRFEIFVSWRPNPTLNRSTVSVFIIF